MAILPKGNPVSSIRVCLLNHCILGKWVGMLHEIEPLLTAVGWAPGLSIFLWLSQESDVHWLIALYTLMLWSKIGQKDFFSLEASGMAQITSTLLSSVPVKNMEYSLVSAVLQILLEHCLKEYQCTWDKTSLDMAWTQSPGLLNHIQTFITAVACGPSPKATDTIIMSSSLTWKPMTLFVQSSLSSLLQGTYPGIRSILGDHIVKSFFKSSKGFPQLRVSLHLTDCNGREQNNCCGEWAPLTSGAP